MPVIDPPPPPPPAEIVQPAANDPLIGNPTSVQGRLTRAGLDLDAPSTALGERLARMRDLDGATGWMVGGRVGYVSAGDAEGQMVDANFERGFRVVEGSRTRLKVSIPISYTDYGAANGIEGGRTGTLALRTALEMPLIEGRWVVEPSAS